MKISELSVSTFEISQTTTDHVARRREMILKYPQLRKLSGYNRWSFGLLLLLVIMQMSMGYFVNDLSIWAIMAVAYFVGSSFALAIMVLVHDATHNLIAKTRTGNYFALLTANVGILWPAAILYKHYHLDHHKYIGRYGLDADMPSKGEAMLVGKSKVRKFLWLIFFPYFYIVARISANKKPKLKWDFIFSLALQIVIFDRMRRMGLDGCAVYLALSPILMMTLSPAMGSRNLLEHLVFRKGQETYSYYGPYNFITLNNGYHTEHHDFSTVPWNRLPIVTKTANEYYENRYIHGSYLSVIWAFIKNDDITLFSRIERFPSKNIAQDDENIPAA